MHLFKGATVMDDEDLNMEEQKAAIERLAVEMAALSEELVRKAVQLQEEIRNVRKAE